MIRTLPDCTVRILVDCSVAGIPDIIWKLGHIQMLVQPLVIGIYNRTISSRRNTLAECLDLICDLLLCQAIL